MAEVAEDEESLIHAGARTGVRREGRDEESEDPSSEVEIVEEEVVEESRSIACGACRSRSRSRGGAAAGGTQTRSDRKPSQFDLLKELGDLSD